MKRVPALMVLLLAAACGDSKPAPSAEHVEMTKLCVDAGGEQAHCECQATKIDELVVSGEVNPDLRKAMLLMAQGKEDEADQVMLSLPYDQRFEHSSLVAERQLECDAPAS